MILIETRIDGKLVSSYQASPVRKSNEVDALKEENQELKKERDWWKEQAYGASDWVDALSNVRCARTCLSLKSTQRGYE